MYFPDKYSIYIHTKFQKSPARLMQISIFFRLFRSTFCGSQLPRQGRHHYLKKQKYSRVYLKTFNLHISRNIEASARQIAVDINKRKISAGTELNYLVFVVMMIELAIGWNDFHHYLHNF